MYFNGIVMCMCTTQGQTGAAAAAAVHQESLPIFAHTHISFGEGWKCAAPNINSCTIFIYRPDYFFSVFPSFRWKCVSKIDKMARCEIVQQGVASAISQPSATGQGTYATHAGFYAKIISIEVKMAMKRKMERLRRRRPWKG